MVSAKCVRISLALGGLVACADPHFIAVPIDGGVMSVRPDASGAPDGQTEPYQQPDTLKNDGAVAPVAPAWAEDLIGAYAARLRIYGRESTTGNIVTVSHEQVSTVQIKYDPAGDRVLYLSQMCTDYAENEQIGQVAQILRPDRYPLRTLEVGFQDGAFFTQTSDLDPGNVGFTQPSSLSCPAGSQMPANAEQIWTDGTCTCSGTLLVPAKSSDCRVTDTDDDGHPGFTLTLKGLVTGEEFCVTRDDSQVVQGKIDPAGRHHANYRVDQQTGVIDCAGGGCTQVGFTDCDPSVNTLDFARITAHPDGTMPSCAEMLSEADAGMLLPSDALRFPSDKCP